MNGNLTVYGGHKAICFRVALLVVVSSLLFSWRGWAPELCAQSPAATGWSNPIDLAAGRPGSCHFPTIVSDAAGGVHVFWDEAIEVPGGSQRWVDYAYWDGSEWSETVDVFIGSASWRPAWGAQAVVDRNGIMHTIWLDDSELKYAQRHVSSPVSARSWINRVTLPALPSQRIGPAAIALDDAGTLHIVYLHASASPPGVYYMRSVNRDKDWETPVLLSDPGWDEWPQDILRYVVDVLPVSDTVHVAWEQSGLGLVYRQGQAQGQEWSAPAVIPQAGKWPNLVAPGDGRLLLFTTGTLNGSMCLKLQNTSLDSGRTWSPAERVALPVKGCLGLINVLRDNDDGYHMVVSGRTSFLDEPERIWYGEGDSARWSLLELVSWPGADYDVLGPQPDFTGATISEGRLLHAVFHTDTGKIWYIRRSLSASRAPSLTFPTLATEAVSDASSVTASVPAEMSQPTSIQAATRPAEQISGPDSQPPRTGNIMPPIVISGIASAVLVGIVLARNLVGRRYR